MSFQNERTPLLGLDAGVSESKDEETFFEVSRLSDGIDRISEVPSEISAQIIDYLGPQDILNLRLASRMFHALTINRTQGTFTLVTNIVFGKNWPRTGFEALDELIRGREDLEGVARRCPAIVSAPLREHIVQVLNTPFFRAEVGRHIQAINRVSRPDFSSLARSVTLYFLSIMLSSLGAAIYANRDHGLGVGVMALGSTLLGLEVFFSAKERRLRRLEAVGQLPPTPRPLLLDLESGAASFSP